MMRAKTEQKVKRWHDQRWLLDTVIQSVGMEWDQPRLGYTMYPAGPDAVGDFRTVGMRVRKFADMHREFAAAARRRETKAENFHKQGRKVSRAKAISSPRCCIRRRAGRSSKTTKSRSATTRAWWPATTSSPPS